MSLSLMLRDSSDAATSCPFFTLAPLPTRHPWASQLSPHGLANSDSSNVNTVESRYNAVVGVQETGLRYKRIAL